MNLIIIGLRISEAFAQFATAFMNLFFTPMAQKEILIYGTYYDSPIGPNGVTLFEILMVTAITYTLFKWTIALINPLSAIFGE
jgi:hypothetical protein